MYTVPTVSRALFFNITRGKIKLCEIIVIQYRTEITRRNTYNYRGGKSLGGDLA